MKNTLANLLIFILPPLLYCGSLKEVSAMAITKFT